MSYLFSVEVFYLPGEIYSEIFYSFDEIVNLIILLIYFPGSLLLVYKNPIDFVSCYLTEFVY